jgi:glycosyltransferase involved in cell wall biosynthesis
LNQTWPDFELLVINDGSSDGTEALASTFPDLRIRLISIEHGGRSRARNEGICRATGEVITFLDSDDRAEPGWLEALNRAFSSGSIAGVCCGARIASNRPEIGLREEKIVLPHRVGSPHAQRLKPFLAGTYAVRRGVLESIGKYDTRLAYGEHSELGIRLMEYCAHRGLTVATVHVPLVRIQNHRRVGGSVEFRERLDAAELVLRRHGSRLREAGASSYANQHAVAGTNAYRLGLTSRAIRHFAAAAFAHPARLVHWARLGLALFPPVARRFWLRHTHLSGGRA